jgi:hypothetical protein
MKGFDGLLTVGENIDVSACLTHLFILHYTSHNGKYFNLEYFGMEPKA